MPKRRYEILLPIMHNDGRQVSPDKFFLTFEELIARFGAFTGYPAPVQGTWVHEGVRYQDESRRIYLDVEDTPENRQFFTEFKLNLRERFEQIEIYIVSYPIEIV
jgi:hypothetical protein